MDLNELGQPVGFALDGWRARRRPERIAHHGQICRIEPLDAARHSADLYAAHSDDEDGRNWTYLPVGPFASFEAYHAWCIDAEASADPLHYTFIDLSVNKPVGTGSLMRMDPSHGVIEVGYLCYAPRMQRSRIATEAMYLMMRYVFDDLGYRRYEWKCDALNAPSRAAAQRLGFTFEGVFRQAKVNKGRNRDTAWYAVLDGEWPALKSRFEAWLQPDNFDAEGRQRRRLADLRLDGKQTDRGRA